MTIFSSLMALSLCLAVEPIAPSKSPWAPDIQRFEEQDKAAPPPQGANLFVGSSSIRLWDVKSSFPGYVTINRGFGGSQIADSLAFADRIITPYRPKVIVFYSGDNDLAFGKSPEQVRDDFMALARLVRGALPEARLVLFSIKPSLQRWNLAEKQKQANQLLQDAIKADAHLTFIDAWTPMLGEDGKPKPDLLAKDGLHMSPKGYALWTSLVEPFLAK